MNPETFWFGRIGAMTMLMGGGGVLVTLFGPGGSLREWLIDYHRELQKDLDFIRLDLTGVRLIGLQFLTFAVALALLFTQHWFLAVIIGTVATGVRPYITYKRLHRVTRLEEQIEPWLTALANALKASPSLGEAMDSTIQLVDSPMRDEVDVMMKEYNLGTPLDRALDNSIERVGGRTYATALTTLKVARTSGGNLPETLETSAKSLREMARLEGVVRTKTADGRAQAWVIGAIPLPLFFGVKWLSPAYFVPLETTTKGNLLLGVAFVFWLVAVLSARKILKVDI